jgi:hypothetical protein
MTVCEPLGLGALGVGGNRNFGSGTGAAMGTGSANCGITTTSLGPTQSTPGSHAKDGCRTKPSEPRNGDRRPRCGDMKMMLGAREGPTTMTPWPWNPGCPPKPWPPRPPWAHAKLGTAGTRRSATAKRATATTRLNANPAEESRPPDKPCVNVAQLLRASTNVTPHRHPFQAGLMASVSVPWRTSSSRSENKIPEPRDLRCRLRLGGERREYET